MSWLMLFAEGEPPQAPSLMDMFRSPLGLIMIMMLVFMIVFSFRSSSRQKREQQELYTKLKKNARVMTSAGIIGYILNIKDDEGIVTLKVDDTGNSKLWVLKSTIIRILDEAPLTGNDPKPAT